MLLVRTRQRAFVAIAHAGMRHANGSDCRPSRIGISGSYGGMNLGGEAILEGILRRLRATVPGGRHGLLITRRTRLAGTRWTAQYRLGY